MSDEILEQEEPELIDLEDEDGNTVTFEFIDALEFNDKKYYALVPYKEEDDSDDDEEEQFVILREQGEGDDTVLVTIDDDDEYNEIGQQFLTRFSTLFGDDDGEILQ